MADIIADVVLLLRAVLQTRGRFGLNLPIEVLRGSRNARTTKQGFDQLPCHGQGAHHSAEHWKAVGQALVQKKLVKARGRGKGFGKGFGSNRMAVYSISDAGRSLLDKHSPPICMDVAADASTHNAQRQKGVKPRGAKTTARKTAKTGPNCFNAEDCAAKPSQADKRTRPVATPSRKGCCSSANNEALTPANGESAIDLTESDNHCNEHQDGTAKPRAACKGRRPVATPSRKRRRSFTKNETPASADGESALSGRELGTNRCEHQRAPDEDGLRPQANPEEIASPSPIPPALDAALMPFQRAGVAFAIRRFGRCLICDDMGLGKTIQAIAVCCGFRADWPAVIVVPNSVRLVWADELERWIPDLGPGGVNIVQTGQDLAGLTSERAAFHIITYGLLARESPVREFLRERGFKVVVIDESHMIKNKSALRTQEVLEITSQASRVILLSGTPALARPEELFTQIRAVEPELFPKYSAYTKRYCAPKWTPYGIDVRGASNLKELHEHLRPIMVRRLKADVLEELPSKRRQRIQLQVDSRAVADLATLKHQLRASTHLSPQAAHKLLMQLYVETGRAKINPVCEYILDLLEGGCKFLVFGHHIEMLDALESAAKSKSVKYIRIDGSVKASERHRQVKEFQANDDIRVAVLGLMAAGVGITLTAASTVVFAELHWTPGVLVQAEDRAHRIGQKAAVNIHYLIARETVDDVIWPSVSHKVQIVSTMCDGRKDRLIASYSSAGDAVESAGRQDIDDLASILEAAPQAEFDYGEQNIDSAAASASQTSSSDAMARVRSLLKNADHTSRRCSFYVSSVTGRVHVLDWAGQPLGQGASFKLTDWEGLWRTGTMPESLINDSAAAQATEAFLWQWFTHKSSEQKELMNRVVTLPLPKYLQKTAIRVASKNSAPKRMQPSVVQNREANLEPSVCSWCKEAEPESGSFFCSPSCELKGSKIHHASFGKSFVGHLLAAINAAGPYQTELEGVTLTVIAKSDMNKTGSRIPSRLCQWNDGWDVRTLIQFEGSEMSFKALKDKLDSNTYAKAQGKMVELKDQMRSVAVQAVHAAKVAAIQEISKGALETPISQDNEQSSKAPAENRAELCRESDETNDEEAAHQISPLKRQICRSFSGEVAGRPVGQSVEPEGQPQQAVLEADAQNMCMRARKKFRAGVLSKIIDVL